MSAVQFTDFFYRTRADSDRICPPFYQMAGYDSQNIYFLSYHQGISFPLPSLTVPLRQFAADPIYQRVPEWMMDAYRKARP